MNVQAATPKLLYHYTSFEAFLNIVKNKSIWVTESRYLNDSTEFRYGFDLAEDVYNNQTDKSDAARWFFENADRELYTYIFSLSKQGDLLSQWRAYCPDGGVSIGFDAKMLQRVAAQHNFELVECIYDKELQREQVRQMLRRKLDNNSFYSLFPQVIAALKHPSFSEEAEFRLVSKSRIRQQQIYEANWRAAQPIPVQYVEVSLSSLGLGTEQITKLHPDTELSPEEMMSMTEFPFEDGYERGLEPFRDIIVGPSAHQELAERAVRDFTSKNTEFGKSGRNPDGLVKVSSSKIPYRAK